MLLIFDWDGTLINSADKITGCMQQAARDLGLPDLSAKSVRQIIGLGLPEAILTLFPDIDAEVQVQFRDLYAKYFVEADQTPCPFFPGVMDTLETLRSHDHQLAVATGKSRRGLNRVLKNLELDAFFHSSRCADETASKPHPKMLLELLGEFDCQPEQALMVGDTSYDLEMAQAANVASVAVSYGAHATENLAQYSPLRFLDEFVEMLDIVAEQQAQSA